MRDTTVTPMACKALEIEFISTVDSPGSMKLCGGKQGKEAYTKAASGVLAAIQVALTVLLNLPSTCFCYNHPQSNSTLS